MQLADAMPTAEDYPPLPLVTLAERLARTVAVARALILAGRVVDLAGIQDGIGLLCAKTLDLQPQQARHMLPALHEMRGQIDSLTLALRRPTTH
jgi:hypothetical protein